MNKPAKVDIAQLERQQIIDRLVRENTFNTLMKSDLKRIAGQVGHPLAVIEALCREAGITAYETPRPTMKAQLDLKAKESIAKGSIFRVLNLNADPDKPIPDDAVVVTTYGELKRERAAIKKLVEDARNGLA